MKAVYDRATDTLTLRLGTAQVTESDESHTGVILDYDAEGNVVGLEILDVSKRNIDPQAFEFRVNG